MHLLGRHRKIWIAALCVLMGLTLAQIAVPPIFAEETQAEKDRQRMLNRTMGFTVGASGSMSGGLQPSKPANSTRKNMKNLRNSCMRNPLLSR
jgi:hypothetical protein